MVKKAFTLMECLIVLIIIGFIIVTVGHSASNFLPDKNKVKFKKAYSDMENTVYTLLSNDALYPAKNGFKYTTPVVLVIGETIGHDGKNSKFREAFKYQINAIKDKIDCQMPLGASLDNSCFMTDNGVVWAIPDTDFENTGVFIQDNFKYVPIAFYTNYKEGATVEDDAFVFGVNSLGKITVIKYNDCNSNDDKMHCKLKDYIHANTIKIKG